MNYSPNHNRWLKGDVVIHDADAKEPKMLMRVIGYTRDGLCKTQYIDTRHTRTIYKNELKYLHQPELFNIRSAWGDYRQELFAKLQSAWESVRIWNHRYEKGQTVRTTSADGGFTTVTTGRAYIDASGDARVSLDGCRCWSLQFVEVISEEVSS